MYVFLFVLGQYFSQEVTYSIAMLDPTSIHGNEASVTRSAVSIPAKAVTRTVAVNIVSQFEINTVVTVQR